VLRQKWSRNQVKVRFANMPPCLIGMEACVGDRGRRRDFESRQECWNVYYSDVHAGTIAVRSGNPNDTDPWEWRCVNPA
jgi:hypothetical protein